MNNARKFCLAGMAVLVVDLVIRNLWPHGQQVHGVRVEDFCGTLQIVGSWLLGVGAGLAFADRCEDSKI